MFGQRLPLHSNQALARTAVLLDSLGWLAMNCRKCGTGAGIGRTMDMGDIVLRRRECECGYAWTTVENDYSVTTNARRNAGAKIGGFVGGSDSDLFSGSEKNGSEPPASSKPPARARRGRKNKHEYTAEFNEVWEATGQRGNKKRAFIAWRNCGEIISTLEFRQLVIRRWGEWMASDLWSRGIGIPYLSSWLNADGFEQEVPESAKRKATPAASKAPETFAQRQERERADRALSEREERAFGGGR